MELPAIETIPGLSLPLLRGDQHPCPYFPDRIASNLYALLLEVDAELYKRMMNLGFRRSGEIFYKPACPSCQACKPIRVPVARFAASRSQRRVRKRNHDVAAIVRPLRDDDEHWRLFQRYQTDRHDGEMISERRAFESFLGRSPIDSFEIELRLNGSLIGVCVVDVALGALSSVYCYYEPSESRRGLGVFGALCEIDECRRRGLAHWYIGFHLAGCRKMEYKSQYRPYELLGPDGKWIEPSDG